MSNFLVQGGAPPDDSVTTVKVKDDAINLAKMAGLARGKLIYGDASGDPAALAVGAANEVLTHDGTDFDWAAAGGGFTLGTEQASTSGSAITFGSIPSGTKMIIINLENVSIDSAAELNVTIGDSGGLETSGYSSSGKQIAGAMTAQTIGNTAAFVSYGCTSGAEYIMSMQWILTCIDTTGLTWMCSHQGFATCGTTVNQHGFGDKTLSGELTQVSVGGGTFDLGSINIMYI
jgi:hypothetical protein